MIIRLKPRLDIFDKFFELIITYGGDSCKEIFPKLDNLVKREEGFIKKRTLPLSWRNI